MKNIELARFFALKLQLIRKAIGIYVGESGIYLAEVTKTIGSAVLNRMAYERYPKEFEDAPPEKRLAIISATVSKCSNQAGIKSVNVFSSPSPAKTVTRYFQTPIIPKKEWQEAIRYEGSRFVPFRLDETVFGYYAKESREAKVLEVVFSAIRINTLREHLRAVEGGGLKIFDTEPAFHALMRALRDKHVKKDEAALAIHLSSAGDVGICIAKGDLFYVCRDFFLSVDDPKYLEKFFSELSSSVDYFKKQVKEEIVPKIFIAGDWDLPIWKQQIENFFHGTNVEIATYTVKNGLELEKSSAFLIPIGLALRNLGIGVSPQDISLLQSGVVAEERIAPRKWTGVVTLVFLLIGVLYYVGFFIPRLKYLQNKLQKTTVQVTTLSAQFPELGNQPLSVLEKRLSDVEAKTHVVEAFQTSKSLLGDKLILLSELTPNSIWFSNLSYDETVGQGGQLAIGARRLNIQAFIYRNEIPEEELKGINEFMDELKKNQPFMKGFNSVTSEGTERATNAGRSFTKFKIACSS